MPITFGSVGDIISLSLLIKDLVKSLDDSRGSLAEYQAVIRELWSLDHTLLEVVVLFCSCKQTTELNALSANAVECAEQCRKCIASFHEQTRTLKRSLQSGGSGSKIRDALSKVRWQVSEKENLAKFRAGINAHFLSMNLLLTTTGITLTKLNDENLQTYLEQAKLARAKSSAMQASDLVRIKGLLEENNTLAKVAASKTKDFRSRFDIDYFRSIGSDMLAFVQKIWNINILTYKAVISLQTSIPARLERCWTQEPAILEDALGRVTPVHLEFLGSWEAFEAVLEVRFRQLPGHRKIRHKEYALRSSVLKKDLEQSNAFNRCFLPGQRIYMSMIFDGGSGGLSSCPGCKLVTEKPEEDLDSQLQCPRCKMWYQRIVESTTPEPQAVLTTTELTQLPATPRALKRKRHSDNEARDEPAQFRRVRLRYWGLSRDLDNSPAEWLSLSSPSPVSFSRSENGHPNGVISGGAQLNPRSQPRATRLAFDGADDSDSAPHNELPNADLQLEEVVPILGEGACAPLLPQASRTMAIGAIGEPDLHHLAPPHGTDRGDQHSWRKHALECDDGCQANIERDEVSTGLAASIDEVGTADEPNLIVRHRAEVGPRHLLREMRERELSELPRLGCHDRSSSLDDDRLVTIPATTQSAPDHHERSRAPTGTEPRSPSSELLHGVSLSAEGKKIHNEQEDDDLPMLDGLIGIFEDSHPHLYTSSRPGDNPLPDHLKLQPMPWHHSSLSGHEYYSQSLGHTANALSQPSFETNAMPGLDENPDFAAESLLAHSYSNRPSHYRSKGVFDDSTYLRSEDWQNRRTARRPHLQA